MSKYDGIAFHAIDEISDDLLQFAVIVAQYNGKWIFCRHKQRDTWEIPGGHREPQEDIAATADRELYEETGAIQFKCSPVCVYSVTEYAQTTYGMLFTADIKTLGPLPPETEIGKRMFSDILPEPLTYPAIQPYLFEKVKTVLKTASQQNAV